MSRLRTVCGDIPPRELGPCGATAAAGVWLQLGGPGRTSPARAFAFAPGR